MAKLSIIKYFKASHGTKNPHEHNFKIELILEGNIENNMVSGVDFHDVKQILEHELNNLSNQYLNEYLNVRATTENIAIYLLKQKYK